MEFRFGQTVIKVNLPTRDALEAAIERRLASGQGFALATINLDHLVKLAADPVFRAAYAGQDLVVADGNPIVWLSRMASRPVELVPGSDMVLPLARIAARLDLPVALLGSTDAALEAAARRMQAEVPGLRVAARIAPPMGFDPDSDAAGAVLHEVRASGAALCFLALGAPKQERLAARARQETPGVGYASIGAGLDFLAGTQQRAPSWVRALALEWAWRMLQAPKRLGPRYAKCAAILPGQIGAALALRRARDRAERTG